MIFQREPSGFSAPGLEAFPRALVAVPALTSNRLERAALRPASSPGLSTTPEELPQPDKLSMYAMQTSASVQRHGREPIASNKEPAPGEPRRPLRPWRTL